MQAQLNSRACMMLLRRTVVAEPQGQAYTDYTEGDALSQVRQTSASARCMAAAMTSSPQLDHGCAVREPTQFSLPTATWWPQQAQAS